MLKISKNFVDAISDALKNGATIYTDMNMELSKNNEKRIAQLGCKYKSILANEEILYLEKEKGITRSKAAYEILENDKKRKIFVIGDTPNTLYKIIDMQSNGKINVDAIIGVPAGFVGADCSKEELEQSEIPHIVSKGKEGGIDLASNIMNAIIYSIC